MSWRRFMVLIRGLSANAVLTLRMHARAKERGLVGKPGEQLVTDPAAVNATLRGLFS